jgi:uncharacterized protein YhfF
MRIVEFGFPGELRDHLVAAVLSGEKTATTGLLVEWELDSEPLPEAGERFVVVDSAELPVAVIELVDARVLALGDVDIDTAKAEGEGFCERPGVAPGARGVSGTAMPMSSALASAIGRGVW